MRYRFYPTADKRLDEIWNYAVGRWGEEQAEVYLRGLFDEIGETARCRSRWRAVREGGFPGVYFFRYKHHFVFFRELKGAELGVISILHESMVLPRRLKEDDGP